MATFILVYLVGSFLTIAIALVSLRYWGVWVENSPDPFTRGEVILIAAAVWPFGLMAIAAELLGRLSIPPNKPGPKP